jgi:Glutaminase
MEKSEPGTTWVVVRSERELSPILVPLQPEAAGKSAMRVSDPGPKCQAECQAAALLHVRRERPVAVLLSADGQLLRLHIPATGRILTYWENPDLSECHFAVAGSPQLFTLSLRSVAGQVIAQAHAHGEEVVVVDDRFDSRPVYVARIAPSGAFPCAGQFEVDLHRLTALDETAACEHYRAIFAQGSVKPRFDDGIPFRYSRAYCEVVAHAVARYFRSQRLVVGKAWAFAKDKQVLAVPLTTSRRQCRERWAFHVAVVARQQDGEDLWVFDPTSRLERGVVSFAEWQAAFGNGLGSVHLTRPDAYTLDCNARVSSCSRKRPCFDTGHDDELDEALMIARCALSCVSQIEGCPPYECEGWEFELPDCR